MDITGIISISGVAGLSKIVARTKSGLIAETLTDKKRFPVQSSDKISALEDISIYTTGDDKPLGEVLKAIYDLEKGKSAGVDPKADPKDLRNYVVKALPEIDLERVYNSDIKKLITWYNILCTTDVFTKTPEPASVTADEASTEGKENKAKAKKSSELKGEAPKEKKTAKPKIDKAAKAPTKSGNAPKVAKTTVRKTGV
jgi:hypothetical protein